MKNFARAISDQQKNERRQKILDSALEIFQRSDFTSTNMADVAKKAGIAKGSVFLYFKTKEELFLHLFAQELQKWNNAYDQSLEAVADKSLNRHQLVRLFVDTLMNQPNLIKLVSLVSNIFGQNLSYEQVAAFKKAFIERIRRTGELLDNKIGFLNEGDGQRFYLYCYALVVGLSELSNPVPLIREVVQSSGYDLLQINFREYLMNMLNLILQGMENQSKIEGEYE